ncbi:hypothetical protein ACJX0J_008489, partial [Zea mays]
KRRHKEMHKNIELKIQKHTINKIAEFVLITIIFVVNIKTTVNHTLNCNFRLYIALITIDGRRSPFTSDEWGAWQGTENHVALLLLLYGAHWLKRCIIINHANILFGPKVFFTNHINFGVSKKS